jgi:mono/diheme cytochrome c family protein
MLGGDIRIPAMSSQISSLDCQLMYLDAVWLRRGETALASRCRARQRPRACAVPCVRSKQIRRLRLINAGSKKDWAGDKSVVLRKQRNWTAVLLVGGALASMQAFAQEDGDAVRGAETATRVCLACHGVRKGERSTNPLAPPFEAIANIKGMSPIALNVALLSPHRAMPNLVLPPDERADVIAYILSLRSK